MKKIISLVIVFAMLLSSVSIAYAAEQTKDIKFTDVDASTDEGKAIYKLSQNGIVNGNGDGTFAPKRFVKRSELCKMINNIWKYTEEDATAFSDVTSNDWYFSHVKIAKKAGYINGFEDGTFRGENYVTREQACAILVRVAGLYDLGLSVNITDTVSPWAEGYVKTVISNTFATLEDGGKFRATEAMTRGELAMLLDDFVNIAAVEAPDDKEDEDKDDKTENQGQTSGNNSSSPSRPSSRPGNSSGNNQGSPAPDDNNGGNTGDEGSEDTPVFDEEKQNEVVENLNALLEEFDTIASLPWITFTEKENGVIDIIKATVNKTLDDAEKGEWIYVEDYVYKQYKEDVDSVRNTCREMEETGEYEAFKNKLKELPIYLLEYLSETMFGVEAEDYM